MRIKKKNNNNNNNNKSRLHFPHKDTQNVWFIVKAKSLWKSPINLFVRREQKLLGDHTGLDQNFLALRVLIPFWKLSSTMTCFTLSYEKFALTMDLHTLKIVKTKSLHKETYSLKEHGYFRRDEVILLNLWHSEVSFECLECKETHFFFTLDVFCAWSPTYIFRNCSKKLRMASSNFSLPRWESWESVRFISCNTLIKNNKSKKKKSAVYNDHSGEGSPAWKWHLPVPVTNVSTSWQAGSCPES